MFGYGLYLLIDPNDDDYYFESVTTLIGVS